MADELTPQQKADLYDDIMTTLERRVLELSTRKNSVLEWWKQRALAELAIVMKVTDAGDNERLHDLAEKTHHEISLSLHGLQAEVEREAGESKLFTVFYAKSLPENPFETPSTFIESDYRNMGTYAARTLEHLFSLLDEPKDQTFVDRCYSLMIHTSMSPGDVAQDEAGRLWMCEMQGWRELTSS